MLKLLPLEAKIYEYSIRRAGRLLKSSNVDDIGSCFQASSQSSRKCRDDVIACVHVILLTHTISQDFTYLGLFYNYWSCLEYPRDLCDATRALIKRANIRAST